MNPLFSRIISKVKTRNIVIPPVIVSGGGQTFLISENFESGAAPAGWTSTSSGTAPDYNYATAPAPLEGTKSVRAATATGLIRIQPPAFTATGDIWTYFLFSYNTFSATDGIFLLQSSGLTTQLKMGLNGGQWYLREGALEVQSTAVTANTKYHVWIHYTKGTGANGVYQLYASTTGVRGTAILNYSNGTATSDIVSVEIQAWNTTGDHIIDKLRVSNTSIGDNPL
jgi:hypothetical protein